MRVSDWRVGHDAATNVSTVTGTSLPTLPSHRISEGTMPRHYLLLLATLSLAGCNDAITPLSPLPAASASMSGSGLPMSSRAWKASCDGTSVFNGPSTLLITGSCQFAPGGRLTVVTHETLNGFALSAVSRYTTPNGDVLSTTSEGSFIPNSDGSGVTFTAIETIVGGTGRFHDVAGTATRTGSIRFGSPNTGSYELTGTLTRWHERSPAGDAEWSGKDEISGI
ncbi:MAG: hypothetical protein ABIV10_06505 [Gemmatimonadaceae bacterium]